MNDNNYGEPWEVKEFRITDCNGKGVGSFGGHADNTRDAEEVYQENIRAGNRAVLCVNACAGMSDEEVKSGMVSGAKHLALLDSATGTDMEKMALEAQLNEAMELLKGIYCFLEFGVSPIHEKKREYIKRINTLVNKHKETNND